MEKFQQIQPSRLLSPYVKQYWLLSIDNAERSLQRYVPSGCTLLAFHRGDRIYSTLHQDMQPRSSLCGPSVGYTDIVYSGNLDLIAVVLSIQDGEEKITELSRSVCLGYKQFKRIFAEYTGLNPKEFLQIARFRKVLHSLYAGKQTHLSRLACDWGYCDKSHLIKDFKAFIGYTPKEYLSVRDPYSEYMSLFHSFFLNGKCETKTKRS